MHEITKYFQRSGRNSLLKIMHELNWMRRGSTVIKMTDLFDLPARRNPISSAECAHVASRPKAAAGSSLRSLLPGGGKGRLVVAIYLRGRPGAATRAAAVPEHGGFHRGAAAWPSGRCPRFSTPPALPGEDSTNDPVLSLSSCRRQTASWLHLRRNTNESTCMGNADDRFAPAAVNRVQTVLPVLLRRKRWAGRICAAMGR